MDTGELLKSITEINDRLDDAALKIEALEEEEGKVIATTCIKEDDDGKATSATVVVANGKGHGFELELVEGVAIARRILNAVTRGLAVLERDKEGK